MQRRAVVLTGGLVRRIWRVMAFYRRLVNGSTVLALKALLQYPLQKSVLLVVCLKDLRDKLKRCWCVLHRRDWLNV